jgi:type II secretory pathway component PulC
LKRTDVLVGVDEWRVRMPDQYQVLADLRHDESMTFTVWRDGRYEQIHATVRERWLGLRLDDYCPAAR